jgi:flagellar motility protein MotE (MotC chaperone)
MLKSGIASLAILASVYLAAPTRAVAQENKKQEVDLGKLDTDGGDGVARYCANIVPSVAEARVAWQMKRLGELEGEVKKRVAELEEKEAAARDWVGKREDLLKKAEDDVVAIYAKMQPEAAAAQLVIMDDSIAAAILSKLNARAASTILNEMEASKAARLADLMLGVAPPSDDGKKS